MRCPRCASEHVRPKLPSPDLPTFSCSSCKAEWEPRLTIETWSLQGWVVTYNPTLMDEALRRAARKLPKQFVDDQFRVSLYV